MKTVDFSLHGKTAVVTGASRGIGKAVALTLAEYGARVILASRKMEGLEAVARQIADDGGEALPIPCHMGKLEDIERLFLAVEERCGRLDILVNNAGANPYFGPIMDAEESAWDKTNDVNLKGPFFASRLAAKLMMQSGGGSIVNVASINGLHPAPLQGIYSITKAALIMMTKAFALELAPSGIRVNAVIPGLVETRFSGAMFQNKDIYNYIIDRVPMKRHGQPEEIAGAVLYLLSGAASFATGACIVCDGGMTM
ncbi:MAG: SDR family oxidoreductase [Deltaproteobacteria bacterium]|nr:SDR family oxidoreductase [Deltaproteobacteria bacterium]